jgi:hypothetical protein
VALRPSVGPWPLLQFRNHFYTDGRASWTSDQPFARPLLHTGQHKHGINAHTDIHVFSGGMAQYLFKLIKTWSDLHLELYQGIMLEKLWNISNAQLAYPVFPWWELQMFNSKM